VSNNPYFAQNYMYIAGPRALLLDNTGHLLLVVSGSGVSAVYEENNSNGSINVLSVRIVNGVARNLNHGIAYNGGYLYVSSPTGHCLPMALHACSEATPNRPSWNCHQWDSLIQSTEIDIRLYLSLWFKDNIMAILTVSARTICLAMPRGLNLLGQLSWTTERTLMSVAGMLLCKQIHSLNSYFSYNKLLLHWPTI
jgi:hypothetical protein